MNAMQEELIYIDQIRNGDSDAYRHLVERYHVGLIIHCEQLLKSRSEAEDMAQEAFVKAYLQLAKYDSSKGRFSTWLYRIATNLCLDSLRRGHRQLDVDDIERIAAFTMPTHIEDDEAERLRQAVRELTPPAYRRIIEAYFWEGKSYQEIAIELDMTPTNVGVSMMRAKARLKEVVS